MSIQSSELFNKKTIEEQKAQLNEKLPGFILSNLVDDITSDSSFRIEKMALKDWRIPEKYGNNEAFKTIA
jgi:hypothetical protein